MARTTRIAIFGGTLLILVAGTALATQVPHERPQIPAAASQEPKSDTPPSADELAHAVDRLKASSIDATAEQLSALAADYGLGGAIRLLVWADTNTQNMSLADLQGMRDDGKGWGQIAKELGLNPGIGSVMGQGGEHGPENAPGQTKEKPEAAESPGS